MEVEPKDYAEAVALENEIQSIPPRDIHWMALQMSELTAWDIQISRLWIQLDSNPLSIPVAKNFLHKLLDAAAKGIRQ